MNRRKSFGTKFFELVDEHRYELMANHSQEQTQPNRLGRFLRWLTPNGGTLLLIAVLIATQQVWAGPLLGATNVPGPSATTVNYQGRLADDAGTPLDGTYGMTFALYDASSGGNLVWGPESHAAVPVSDGLFSIGLGSQTSGGIPTSVWNGDVYLEVTVSGETLEPRELIRSVPIAGMALTVPDGAIESRHFQPTFFFAEYPGPDDQVLIECTNVVELDVDFPVDATYTIFATLHARQTVENKRTVATLVDENNNRVGTLQLVMSHPTGGVGGSQSTTGVTTHNFAAGAHKIRLRVCGVGAPTSVRTNSTSILAIPFFQTP